MSFKTKLTECIKLDDIKCNTKIYCSQANLELTTTITFNDKTTIVCLNNFQFVFISSDLYY